MGKNSLKHRWNRLPWGKIFRIGLVFALICTLLERWLPPNEPTNWALNRDLFSSFLVFFIGGFLGGIAAYMRYPR